MEGFMNSFMLFSFLLALFAASMAEDLGTYIIHVDKSAMPMSFSTHHDWYLSMLSSMTSSDGVLPTHLYTYNHVLDGFSAVLSREHLDQLERTPGFLAIHADAFGKLHTTRSPTFLGLDKNLGAWPESNFGEDTIIGIIDTGIWPESQSFKDKGMGPVPDRWRGACESGAEFNSSNCNRKLIGARSFSKGLTQNGYVISKPDYDSPRDNFGHGTHTASTAAGSPVRDANYFGYARGTATGIAPKARLAAYKVLFINDTDASAASDTLAGMDQAIADGVDLMSLSLGFEETTFEQNPIAVGAFAAMEKGIFVSCSAGNSGPDGYTMINGAPWITTIGAGTIDRDYAADATFGNGIFTVRGRSLYPENMFVSNVSLYFGYGNRSKELCEDSALDPAEVSGKIVFCDFNKSAGVNQRYEVNRTGAVGAIISSDSDFSLLLGVYFLPLVVMTPKDGDLVKDYIIKTENPVVDIKFLITVLGSKPAPQVAWFSSRGPNNQAPMILKPDVLAPGVDILAAWASNSALTRLGNHLLLSDYMLLSGTSMSSPHAVGVAALLKSANPEWSPAAIRSALMTTAYLMDNTMGSIIDMDDGVAATPLDFGGGHVNPSMAMDPGLVYDIEVQDYINFLCGLNYTSTQIKIITRRSKFSCDQANLDLNYPSFMILLDNNSTTTASYTFKRVLTNVADSPSFYRASLELPSGMQVKVEPSNVSFAGKYSKAEFNMTVEINLGNDRTQGEFIGNYGYLYWLEVNGTHMVRSPIVSAFAL